MSANIRTIVLILFLASGLANLAAGPAGPSLATIRRAVIRQAGVPVAESRVVARAEAAKGHVIAPPYVIKPPAEGSSVGVYIVREDQEHPPQELNSADWALGEELMVVDLGSAATT